MFFSRGFGDYQYKHTNQSVLSRLEDWTAAIETVIEILAIKCVINACPRYRAAPATFNDPSIFASNSTLFKMTAELIVSANWICVSKKPDFHMID